MKSFDLQQKKDKVLQAKELKIKIIKSKSEELEKKRKRIIFENIKQKILIERKKMLKEKENNEKKKENKRLKRRK